MFLNLSDLPLGLAHQGFCILPNLSIRCACMSPLGLCCLAQVVRPTARPRVQFYKILPGLVGRDIVPIHANALRLCMPHFRPHEIEMMALREWTVMVPVLLYDTTRLSSTRFQLASLLSNSTTVAAPATINGEFLQDRLLTQNGMLQHDIFLNDTHHHTMQSPHGSSFKPYLPRSSPERWIMIIISHVALELAICSWCASNEGRNRSNGHTAGVPGVEAGKARATAEQQTCTHGWC